MKTSESLENLAPALVAAKRELKNNIEASGKNPLFRSSYVPLDVMVETVAPILLKHGLVMIQSVCAEGERAGAKTMLLHDSGEFIESDGGLARVELSLNKDGRPTNSYGQAAGSLVTYFRRYDGMALLGLAETDKSPSAQDAHVERGGGDFYS